MIFFGPWFSGDVSFYSLWLEKEEDEEEEERISEAGGEGGLLVCVCWGGG